MTTTSRHQASTRRSWVAPILVTVLAAIAAMFVTFTPASAAANNYWLNPGETLVAGQHLASPDGQYVLVMQNDGNAVIYAPGSRAVWATGTMWAGSDLEMQSDGNLVVYSYPGHVAAGPAAPSAAYT